MGAIVKDVIHVSDKEAADDFASLLARIGKPNEIVEHLVNVPARLCFG